MPGKFLIARDVTEDRRLGRFTEQVAIILNSLIQQDVIRMTGVEAFQVVTGNVFYGDGPPAAALGVAPAIYFDIGDPTDLKFWYKT